MVFIVTSYSFSDKFLLKSENLQHNKGWFAYLIVYTSRHNPFIWLPKQILNFAISIPLPRLIQSLDYQPCKIVLVLYWFLDQGIEYEEMYGISNIYREHRYMLYGINFGLQSFAQ